MKKVDGYWVDDNGNKWDCTVYTEDQAIAWSGTLINCTDCINCENCKNCNSCNFCNSCKSCKYCSSCNFCNSCKSCKSCKSCNSCKSCKYCKSCYSCESCYSCKSCYSCESCDYCNSCESCYSCKSCYSCESCKYCESFEENPSRFTKSEYTVNHSNTMVYWNKDRAQIVCGCFNGTLAEFITAVDSKYGDYSDHFYYSFIRDIKMICAV